MDRFIAKSVKNGKDINEVLNMPYSFVLNVFAEEAKPKQTESLIAAFGG